MSETLTYRGRGRERSFQAFQCISLFAGCKAPKRRSSSKPQRSTLEEKKVSGHRLQQLCCSVSSFHVFAVQGTACTWPTSIRLRGKPYGPRRVPRGGRAIALLPIGQLVVFPAKVWHIWRIESEVEVTLLLTQKTERGRMVQRPTKQTFKGIEISLSC
jgi:hypothetical protein